jgi:hypothetical protein
MRKRITSFLLAAVLIFILLPTTGFADSAAVYTYAEFKAAVESSTVHVINLMADIQLQKGVTLCINPNKPSLVINGVNPPQLAPRTITQPNSAKEEYSFKLDASKSNMTNITFDGVNINGANKNGLINISTKPKNKNFLLAFNKINYTGPLLAKAKYCNVLIDNSSITVASGNNICDSYLVSACNISLSGVTAINKSASGNAQTIFSMDAGTFTVTPTSNVTINNPAKKSAFINVGSRKSTLMFGESSKFTYNGLSKFATGCNVGSVYLANNAEVNVIITGDLEKKYGFMEIDNILATEPGAVLRLIAPSNTKAHAVIEMESKSKVTFNAPKEVLVYNSTQKCEKEGMALMNDCHGLFEYKDVISVEYWVKNKAPYTALANATSLFKNANNSPFSAFITMCNGKAEKVLTSMYSGQTAINSKTAGFKDVNVIRITGRSSTIDI